MRDENQSLSRLHRCLLFKLGEKKWNLCHKIRKKGHLCFRVLLVFIAILSAYSIHLLLKSAGVVGKSRHCSHITYHTCPIKCLWYFRHPSLRAAREPGFRPPWKNAGCLHHHRPQHRRYFSFHSFIFYYCCTFCC